MQLAARRTAAESTAGSPTHGQSGDRCPGRTRHFGVEFFIVFVEMIFSEFSPRPHDTGLVTLREQNFSEFEMHLRAVLGMSIPSITRTGVAASRVLLAGANQGGAVHYRGVAEALALPEIKLLLFGKPKPRPCGSWAWLWPAGRA